MPVIYPDKGHVVGIELPEDNKDGLLILTNDKGDKVELDSFAVKKLIEWLTE